MSAADGAILEVRVVPRAGRTQVGRYRGDALVIRLAAAPVDGAANQALTEFLARLLEVPRRDVTIVGGERSRNKRVRIGGLSTQELTTRLSALVPR
jgi:uncharacterized protein (TIGR00251 family)